MSGFNVSNRPVENVHGAVSSQAEPSQSLLKDYRAHISRGAGEVKSGVLHIDNRGSEQKLPRDKGLDMHSHKSEDFRAAANQIKSHFQQAYEGKVSADALKGLMAGLDAYLQAPGNQSGSKTFAKLVDAFENGTASFHASQPAGRPLLPNDPSFLRRAAGGFTRERVNVEGPVSR